MSIALIGNPNCGKTTLFNLLTGAKQRVGNWPGVTVERKTGIFSYNKKSYEIVDLPGTYAIESDTETTSQDEMIARDYVLTEKDSVIVNIIDATNLQRSLYLTFQLIDLNLPLIVVLNMIDAVNEIGEHIDTEQLSQLLGCPVVAISSTKKKGIDNLYRELERLAVTKSTAKPTITTLADAQNQAIEKLLSSVPAESYINQLSRWQLLEALLDSQNFAFDNDELLHIEACRQEIAAWCDNEVDIAIASSRYEAIDQICKTVIDNPRVASYSLSDKIDRVALGRITGIPFFLLAMYLMFIIAVKFGSVFIDFFDVLFATIFVDGLSHVLNMLHAPDWLTVILADGIGTGVQTVATFIPVIAAMFFCLSFLEDSGYLARAAMVVDRGMRAIGLPGKAFVPMLVGFGCGVPAIMGTRTLESTRDRIMSICMIPFMSCGARLPVYALLAVIFFPNNASTVVFILYLLGIVVAIVTGFVLKFTLLKGDVTPFIMEMPVYRIPTLRSMASLTWQRLKSFIFKAGKAIILMVTVLSVLNSLGTDGSFGNQDSDNSVLSVVSQKVTPVFEPMGVTAENWPATVGIFTGIFAKEAVIATLNSLYSMQDDSEDDGDEFSLVGGIKDAFLTIPENLAGLGEAFLDPLGLSAVDEDIDSLQSNLDVTPSAVSKIESSFGNSAAAMAYLIFILLYTPCAAALGAVYREAGAKWTAFVAVWTFIVGWICATAYFQFTLLGTSSSAIAWLVGLMVIFALIVLIMKFVGRHCAFAAPTLANKPAKCSKSSCCC
ncbi:ferrous iron transport protein B [Orbus hercynius]|uniref:Ferrous iron transport protein B n=1 Tax=Orbus hercynius TaxID=593135 RepID=A0A495RCJ0_9GAMM|nr:Fe(2+) transporter permease subunit FeoB [Orbus hercynius]RKS85183.1 ferrous iron transport protein B [Orbus hercynius]